MRTPTRCKSQRYCKCYHWLEGAFLKRLLLVCLFVCLFKSHKKKFYLKQQYKNPTDSLETQTSRPQDASAESPASLALFYV